MKREFSLKPVGSFLIIVSIAAFVVSESSFREINETMATMGGEPLSLGLRIAAYFNCMLVFITGIALYLRSSKLSGSRRSHRELEHPRNQ